MGTNNATGLAGNAIYALGIFGAWVSTTGSRRWAPETRSRPSSVYVRLAKVT